MLTVAWLKRVGIFNPWGVESVEKFDTLYPDIDNICWLTDYVSLPSGSEADDHTEATSIIDRPWTYVPVTTSTQANGVPMIVFGATQLDSASMSALAAQDSSASVQASSALLLATEPWTRLPSATTTSPDGERATAFGWAKVDATTTSFYSAQGRTELPTGTTTLPNGEVEVEYGWANVDGTTTSFYPA